MKEPKISMIEICDYAKLYLQNKIDDLNCVIDSGDKSVYENNLVQWRDGYERELNAINDVIMDLVKLNY